EEANKKNLSLDSPLGTSIVPTSKILKAKVNEVEDVSSWIKHKNEEGWATTISLKHLKNLIASGKKSAERKESKMEHVVLTENWDVYLIRSIIENIRKQQELIQKKQVEINSKKNKTKKVSSEEKKKKNNIGKGIDKGEGGDLYEGFEDRFRRQKSEDK
ncbi:44455_t:CDS:2, partial [Gigaspora margarita]